MTSSWPELRANALPITLLAVGLVVLTIAAVAAVANAVIGLPWAEGFVLGAVLGPTDPNRIMAISASIDPSGSHGGPVLSTASNRVGMTGKLNWETMPEALLKAGVSWKVYNDPTGTL